MALPSTNTITALFLVIDDSGQMAKIKKDLVMTKCKNVVMIDHSSKVPGGNFYSSICFQVYRRHNKVKIKSIGMIKRHLKPTKENKGGIISKESFIHQSNVKNIDVKINDKKKTGKK